MTDPSLRVLFVCLGNICRSPTAEGVFLELLRRADLQDRIDVDSAGTGDWHVGELPDPRTRRTAARRGYRLDRRARQVRPEDLSRFDYVLAMDDANLRALRRMAPRQGGAVVGKLLDFHPDPAVRGTDVPDPYYGGDDGFERVLDLCEVACEELLAHVRRTHGL